MADLSELRAQINEAEMALATLQAQLEVAEKQEASGTPVADSPADGEGQGKPTPEDDSSFAEVAEERFNSDELLEGLPDHEKQAILQAEADEEAAEMEKEDASVDTTGNAHLASLSVGQKEISADPSKAPVETETEPELDLETLWETVYGDGQPFDPDSEVDLEKMGKMRDAIESDPRLAKLAATDPERFALYMYGRKSALQ